MAGKGTFTLAATGDALITRRISPYKDPEFLDMLKLIRSADVAFTNLEMLLHRYEGFPAAESGGTYCVAEPQMADELVWAGFHMVSRANNHSLDWSDGGLSATSRECDRAGLVHAGVGPNLSQARSPAYLDFAKGRAALLSASSTFASFGRAGNQRPDMPGRPGLNPLRYDTTYVVTAEEMAQVKKMAGDLGLEYLRQKRVAMGFEGSGDPSSYSFGPMKFVVGDKPGIRTTPHKGDMEGNLKFIRDAARQADWVFFSLHAHEANVDKEIPATFIQPFAKACIDAGTTAFIGHGPHVLRGIEVYKGKPIFYSLGNFIFQNESVRYLPADVYERYGLGYENTPADLYDIRTGKDTKSFPSEAAFWESVLAICTFEDDEMTECTLYPLTLGFGGTRAKRGRPELAKGALAEKIIGGLADLSKPFGTTIHYEAGAGKVEL